MDDFTACDATLGPDLKVVFVSAMYVATCEFSRVLELNVFLLQGRVRAVVSARMWTDDWSQGALLGTETSMISFTVQKFTVLRSSYKREFLRA